MRKKSPRRHVPLIVGNWKMNPATVSDAKKLFLEIRKKLPRTKLGTDIAIAPPAVYIAELQRLSPSHRIALSAQDVFDQKVGAYTGEIAPSMLQSVGVSSVIIGHSERRALGDTNEQIHKNVAAVVQSGMTAIVCVGESERDTQGTFFTTVESQLIAALSGIPASKLSKVVIAYEPVWAIGTGNHATPEDVHEMKLFITKVLSDLFDRKSIGKVRIVYGGSVQEKNADELLRVGEVDGFLIGGASLKPAEFVSIIKIAEQYVAA